MASGLLPKSPVSSSLCDEGPSHIYSKIASRAQRIFDQQCKKTFATQSATSRHSKSDSRQTDPYSAGCAAPPRFVAPCSPDARAAKNVITAQASEQAARKYRPAWKLPVESLIQPTTKGPT